MVVLEVWSKLGAGMAAMQQVVPFLRHFERSLGVAPLYVFFWPLPA